MTYLSSHHTVPEKLPEHGGDDRRMDGCENGDGRSALFEDGASCDDLKYKRQNIEK